MSEGNNIARVLKKQGWTVERRKSKQWVATHPDTDITLHWYRGSSPQRLADQAAAALGTRVRTTSGRGRKKTQQLHRHREQVAAQQHSRAAQDALQHIKEFERRRRQPQPVIAEPVDIPDADSTRYDVHLTDNTWHAITQAEKRNITGAMIQDALVYPQRILPGYHDCTKYVGKQCTVVVTPGGVVMTVY